MHEVHLKYCDLSVPDIGHPYSLDVFEGHVYWTTKEKGEVWKTNKFGKGNKVKVLTINPWLTQVRIYQEHRHNLSGESTEGIPVMFVRYCRRRNTRRPIDLTYKM